MKLIIKSLNSIYLLLCLIFALVFYSLNVKTVNEDKSTYGVIDLDFLNNINALKSKMIKEGSEFKNVALKFISNTIRYVIADENFKVNDNMYEFRINNLFQTYFAILLSRLINYIISKFNYFLYLLN